MFQAKGLVLDQMIMMELKQAPQVENTAGSTVFCTVLCTCRSYLCRQGARLNGGTAILSDTVTLLPQEVLRAMTITQIDGLLRNSD